jgi:hypothetical protein
VAARNVLRKPHTRSCIWAGSFTVHLCSRLHGKLGFHTLRLTNCLTIQHFHSYVNPNREKKMYPMKKKMYRDHCDLTLFLFFTFALFIFRVNQSASLQVFIYNINILVTNSHITRYAFSAFFELFPPIHVT